MSAPKLLYKLSRLDRDINIPGVYVKKPKVIGCVENDGVQLKTTNKMKYFKVPKGSAYPLDLNAGFENYRGRSETFKWKLNKVACFMMNPTNELNRNPSVETSELSVSGELDDNAEFEDLGYYDIITHRGTLALLMETPYMVEGPTKKWTIVATKYNKKLYLSSAKNQSTFGIESRRNDPQFSYHFKFEQYCFSDDPNRDPDTNSPINEEEQIYCIYSTQLLNFNLIYSAEINGIISDKKLEHMEDINALERNRFVHTKLMPDRVRNWTKNFRLCRWWIKAYLARVDDVYVGMKTDDGLIRQPVKHMLIKQLPEGQRWSPKVCVNFMYTFIKMVLKEMRSVDSPEKCYEFNFDSSDGSIYFHINERPFLTEDFIEWLKRADA